MLVEKLMRYWYVHNCAIVQLKRLEEYIVGTGQGVLHKILQKIHKDCRRGGNAASYHI